MRKPPLGIKPRYLIDEERFIEIREAMVRFGNRHKVIPLEWVEEYNELVDRINKRGDKADNKYMTLNHIEY